jgi:F0F1-type ATP synthase membrane subunit b/b'
MEEELAAGRRMPFGGGVTVDRKRFSELINELRLAIPANVRQARGILERSEQAIAEAQAESARLIAAAEREAGERVANSEVMRRAQEEAHKIELAAQNLADRTIRAAEEHARQVVAEAERIAQEQKTAADDYAVALLSQLQQMLGTFLGNVRTHLREFPEREQGE